MKRIIALPLLLACAGPLTASAASSASSASPAGKICSQARLSERDVRGMIAGWPDTSRRAAESMLDQHGAPVFAGCTTLLWRGAGPFAKIVVTRDAVGHEFPGRHDDVISHEVGMRVPVEKVGELARFDGSLLVDRTKGTVTARSDSEPHNIALLNLAREIIDGKKDVASARQEYSAAVSKGLAGKESAASSRLSFESDANSADPDSAYGSGPESAPRAVPGGIPAPSSEASGVERTGRARPSPMPGESGPNLSGYEP